MWNGENLLCAMSLKQNSAASVPNLEESRWCWTVCTVVEYLSEE